MRRVVLHMSMTLDGYVASDRQHPGMLAEDDELVAWKLGRITRAGAHLMGRTTYSEMAAYWPTSTGPYAQPMNDIDKIVFSATMDDGDADWPTTRVARGDLAAEITAIKNEPGPDVIAWGGASFGAALAGQNLVDEYRLAVQPVATGSGHALFRELAGALHLELVEGATSPAVSSCMCIDLHPGRSDHRNACKQVIVCRLAPLKLRRTTVRVCS